MKNIQSLLYVCIVVTALNIAALVFFVHRNVPPPNVLFSPSEATVTTVSDIFLPEKICFSGEEVPIHRVDIQESLKKELIVNSYLHSHTIQALKIAPRVFPIIEPILKAEGIPDDFKYLAVIESNLNPLATSPAGAVGVWQFMEDTGKEFGLEVNGEVDERYHIAKSTRAAARYLKKAYARFGSWTTAAASYNAGMRMISNQIDKQKEAQYYDLLLGEETGRYVFRILALKQIMENPGQYNFQVAITYPIEEFNVVRVNGKVDDWAVFAKQHGVSYKTLKRFNPWLRKTDLRNAGKRAYELNIPVKTENYR